MVFQVFNDFNVCGLDDPTQSLTVDRSGLSLLLILSGLSEKEAFVDGFAHLIFLFLHSVFNSKKHRTLDPEHSIKNGPRIRMGVPKSGPRIRMGVPKSGLGFQKWDWGPRSGTGSKKVGLGPSGIGSTGRPVGFEFVTDAHS
mgnify:CR=1 FL=1